MSWFQLDASTIACRVQADGDVTDFPSLPGSILRGIVGFTIMSVAGFVPWAVFGPWFLQHLGEGSMFGACAIVFILLSGLLLHPLIIGPGSLLIFYKLFSLTFVAYALAWIIGWTCLGGDVGSIVGLLAGAVVMGWMLSSAFEIPRAAWKVIVALFILTAAGYFGGAWMETQFLGLAVFAGAPVTQATVAKLLWGMCYGIGFGAALGVAFYICQADVRKFLHAESVRGTGVVPRKS